MAPKGSRKGKGKATARAKMPTSVINRRLSLDRDRRKGFILEHIHGVIRIYNVWGVKDERAWDLFCDIIFLDPVTTSVSNGLKLLGRFRVRFHPNPDRGNGSYHTKNPDRSKWGSFTTKNPAFQIHLFGSIKYLSSDRITT